MSVCVCLSVRHLRNCICMLSVALFFSGGVAIRYVIPVLWVTSCLHVMAKARRREKAHAHGDSMSSIVIRRTKSGNNFSSYNT